MGAVVSPAAPREARGGEAEQGPSDAHHRQPVAAADRGAVARPARAIWPLVDGVQSVLAVAGGRDLGPALRGRPAGGRRRRRGGLERPLRGRQRDPRAPARRWCKGGDPATEALGKSQGGFGTKVHVKAEGGGKGLTVLLTPGQQHEATVFDRLMHQGAVRRPGRGRPRLRPDRAAGDKTKGIRGAAIAPPCADAASATPSPSAAPSSAPDPSIAPPTVAVIWSSTCSPAASSSAPSPPATTSAATPSAPLGSLS